MALTYPGAIMKTYPVGDRTLQTKIEKFVWHSTETTTVPGYNNGYAGMSSPRRATTPRPPPTPAGRHRARGHVRPDHLRRPALGLPADRHPHQPLRRPHHEA